MKHQRRDTSVLFSLKDLAKSKNEAPSEDTEATLIDLSASAEAEEKTSSFDPFQQFDSGEKEEPKPSTTKSVPISIKAPVLKRKGLNPMIQTLLVAIIAGGGTAAGFVLMNKSNDAPTTQVAPVAETAANVGEAKEKTGGATEEKNAAAVAAKDAGASKDVQAVAATSDAGSGDVSKVAAADVKPKEESPAKPVKTVQKPRPAAKPAPARRPVASSTKPRPTTTRPRPRPAPVVKPKPTPVATPAPNPSNPANDINAMLGQIRNKPAPSAPAASAPSARLPDKPTVRQIKQVVGKLRPQVSACYKRHNPGGGTVRLKARVSVAGKTGRVVSAEVLTAPYAMNQTGSCIIGVLRNMSFSPFAKEKHTFRVPFLVP